MLFINNLHKDFYEDCISKTRSHDDPYRKSLFYTLGLTDETRRHINTLYDFEERGIEFIGLFEPWQTSTSKRVTRLAFNLYNGFTGDTGEERKDDATEYSPENLFCTGLMMYFFEAIKLRYPEYYHASMNAAEERAKPYVNPKCTHNLPVPCEECAHYYPDSEDSRPVCQNNSGEGHIPRNASEDCTRGGNLNESI